jgi:hypothetical protein
MLSANHRSPWIAESFDLIGIARHAIVKVSAMGADAKLFA